MSVTNAFQRALKQRKATGVEAQRDGGSWRSRGHVRSSRSQLHRSWRELPRKGRRVGLHIVLFEACPRRSLALRPAHSRGHQFVTRYTEGFSHFVTSMTAPVASGWSRYRVGLSPTGKRRLSRRTPEADIGDSELTRSTAPKPARETASPTGGAVVREKTLKPLVLRGERPQTT